MALGVFLCHKFLCDYFGQWTRELNNVKCVCGGGQLIRGFSAFPFWGHWGQLSQGQGDSGVKVILGQWGVGPAQQGPCTSTLMTQHRFNTWFEWVPVVIWAMNIFTDSSYCRTTAPDVVIGSSLGLSPYLQVGWQCKPLKSGWAQ